MRNIEYSVDYTVILIIEQMQNLEFECNCLGHIHPVHNLCVPISTSFVMKEFLCF
jgi:hypothetical protein